MPRFRLRFLLQEFDLVGPEVVLGRSPECHITIEDPLISRKHARIVIRGDEATLMDLGSRNGVRLNGRTISAETSLRDGDRVRLGTQELLFSILEQKDRPARPTGYMRVCHACGTAYPEGSPSCPHCGAAAIEEEETTASGVSLEPQRSWTFQLLGEVIERALTRERGAEADRLMRRAAKEVDDRLAAGERLDSKHISMISSFAVRLARLLGSSEWAAWALALHQRQGRGLAPEVIDRLAEMDLHAMPDARTALRDYVQWLSTAAPTDGGIVRLQQLIQ